MSISRIFGLAILSVILMTLTGGFFLAKKDRQPQSLKPQHLSAKPWAHSVKGKMGRHLEVRVYPLHQSERVYIMRGEITALKSVNGPVNFHWVIPSGVKVMNGEIDGVSSVNPGETATTEILVELLDEKFDLPIVLQVKSDQGEYALGAAGTTDLNDLKVEMWANENPTEKIETFQKVQERKVANDFPVHQ